MKHLQLQPRLRLLADMVPAGAHLADIGTDHGYLPVWLMQQGRITSAIAADIGPEPLAHARRTAAEYGAALDLRLCDGLRGIAAHEADTVVIAGMGGETIIQILTDSPWPRDSGCTLLLQPQTKVELLRLWLSRNGYACENERLVWDKGKLYVVLQMTAGEPFTPDEARLYAGFCLENDPLYGDYLEAQLRRLRHAAGAHCRPGEEKGGAFMITVRDIEQFLYDWAPPDTAESWDNVGLLVGRPDRPVRRVLVALDVTPAVAAEAAELGADLIVAHHPVMNVRWHEREMQTLRDDTRLGGLLTCLVRQDLSVICMHTNLDAAEGGVNDCLAQKLGLSGAVPLNEQKIGRIGTLSCEIPLEQFLHDVVKSLSCRGLRYRDGGRPVHRVAVGGGACGEYIPQALAQGCDTFVTSDLRYNDFLDTRGLNLIDAGHFPTEDVVCPEVVHRLQKAFPAICVSKSAVHRDAVQYYMIEGE